MYQKRMMYWAVAAAFMLSGCGTQSISPSEQVKANRDAQFAQHDVADDLKKEAEKRSNAKSQLPEERLRDDAATLEKPLVEFGAVVSAPGIAANGLAQGFTHNLAELRAPTETVNRENYAHFNDNPVKRVAENPVSTFSIDVDTGAYTNVRRMLNAGALPTHDAVRVEEFINYFDYDYAVPKDKSVPFSVTSEVGPNPWRAGSFLLQIGLKGYEVPASKIPASNLVFLVDVSGSMQSPDKLDLLKSSLKLLSKALRAQDRLAIVVYAGASGVVLDTVAGNDNVKISAALDSLTAGGSTNGGAGIRLAYALAEKAFIKGGINRVLLATDGDFNVGTTSFEALKDLVEHKRQTGVSLTTLGFGTGNYNDQLMEQLADAGNGNYAYIDNLNEGRKVLVEQMSATLQTIAKDVKIQLEFNPRQVAEYRLVGYENRTLAREDFNNDKVDAGEIGAGHAVTALYEIVLTNSHSSAMRSDALRYQAQVNAVVSPEKSAELGFLRLRYKAPEGDVSQLIEQPILATQIKNDLAQSSERFRFATAVAGFGQLLRGGKFTESFAYDDVLQLARGAKTPDDFGYRGEFLQLVLLAKSLASTDQQAAWVEPGEVMRKH